MKKLAKRTRIKQVILSTWPESGHDSPMT